MSINARDALFDNRIATFVLSISNLVIINNKGELTAQLRDLLQICMFAMKHLRSQSSVGVVRPQKLIFTLQGQSMPGENDKFQEQAVAKIKTCFE